MTFAGQPAFRWRVGPAEFVAVPNAGARLVGWRQQIPAGERDLLHWPEDPEGRDFATVRGGNPILFPFCARTFVDGAIHFWRDAGGTVRPMPLHGFARQAEFRTAALDEHGFRAELVPGGEARAAYPFEYRFEVEYRFHATGFEVDLALANLGSRPLPWSAGHHFYISVPWRAGTSRRDYTVSIPATRAWRQDPAGRLQEMTLPARRESLASERLVATMHGGLYGEELSVTEMSSGERLSITLPGVRPRFPDAVFTTWTADEGSAYFCFEPWIGPANAPELGAGLDLVPPGQRHVFSAQVQFHPVRPTPP